MITSKDLFIDERIREELDRSKLLKQGREIYLTLRKEERIRGEKIKPVKSK